jgi:hypothetical protein
MAVAAFIAPSGAVAADARGGAGADLAQAGDGDWRAYINRTVVTKRHFKWVLRAVERKADTLIVGLAVKNNASSARPLFLDENYKTTVALVDKATDKRFALLSAEGISEQIIRVGRKASKEITFVFRYPEGAASVRFTSVWLTMLMGGQASVIPVDFTVQIPPPEADIT